MKWTSSTQLLRSFRKNSLIQLRAALHEATRRSEVVGFWVVTSALLNRLSLPFPLQPLEIKMENPQLTCSQGVWCQNLKVTNDQCSQSAYACKCSHAHIITYPPPGRCNNGGAFRDVRMIVSMSLHASCFGHQLHWSRKVVVVTYSWNKLGHSGWAAGELMKRPRSQIAQSINTKFKKHNTAVLFPWHKKSYNKSLRPQKLQSVKNDITCHQIKGINTPLPGLASCNSPSNRGSRDSINASGWHRACGTVSDHGGRCFRDTARSVKPPFLQFFASVKQKRPKHLDISRSSSGPTAGPTAKVSNKQESCSMDPEECSLYSL